MHCLGDARSVVLLLVELSCACSFRALARIWDREGLKVGFVWCRGSNSIKRMSKCSCHPNKHTFWEAV